MKLLKNASLRAALAVPLALLVGRLLLSGGRVASADAPSADPVASLRPQQGWTVEPAGPCIAFGDFRTLASWNDPCVLKSGDGFIMYLTTAMALPGRPPVQPFRAVSNDGLQWRLDPAQPLLAPGANLDNFDAQSVETPSVIQFNGAWHLYYTGVKRGMSGPMAIGHATSPDGIHWTKDARGAVLAPTGAPTDVGGLQVAEPAAVVFGEKIHVYVTAVGIRHRGGAAANHPPASRVIALATSLDGSTFTPLEPVLSPGDCYPASAGFDGYSTPFAAIHDGRMHLFFDVGYFSTTAERKWSQVALHHAVSPDGTTHWTQDAAPILVRTTLPWTSLEVRAPSALFDGETLHLWFAGNADPKDFLPEVRSSGKTKKFGIGHMTVPAARFSNPRP